MTASTRFIEANAAKANNNGSLNRALLLARQGNFTEAADFLRLAREANECSDAEALDLQARMCVQQGMLLRAETCWMEALRLSPGNTAYLQAIARLRSSNRPLHRIWTFLYRVGVATIAFAVFALCVLGYRHISRQQEDTAIRLARVETDMSNLQRTAIDLRNQATSQFDATSNDIRKARADISAAVSQLPTSSKVDDELHQLSAANQVALDHVSAESKQRGDLLTSQQAAISGAIKADQDQQALALKSLASQLDQSEKNLALLRTDTSTGIDGLQKRIDATSIDIRHQLEVLRDETRGYIWFRWPFPQDASGQRGKASGIPTTKSSSTTRPAP